MPDAGDVAGKMAGKGPSPVGLGFQRENSDNEINT